MRKITIALFFVLMYTGCSVNEDKDDRICLDYGSYTLIQEKCVPLYGTLICADEERTYLYCKLYDEESEDEVLLNKS